MVFASCSLVWARRSPKIVIAYWQERSQLQNKEKALQMLKAKLYALELEKQKQAKAELEKTKKRIDFGSQMQLRSSGVLLACLGEQDT